MRNSIALFGLGYWGKNLLRNLFSLGLIHTACDLNSDRIREAKIQYPGINYISTPEHIFKNEKIKAIVIATPSNTHYHLVKKALLTGKDVFVEKPMAMTVSEGRELVHIARKKKLILMVGHILHYHPAILKLKEIISSAKLGRIQYIYSNRLNIGKLRTEENILWSFAPHDISAILMLIGDFPVEINTFGGDYISDRIADITLTTFKFKNKIKGHIFVSWLHPFKEQKLVVVGSKAMAVFDDLSKEKLFVYRHRIEWNGNKIPIARKADFKIVPILMQEPLRLELEHFINCIRTRKIPNTDGLEGLKVLKFLEQAENSLFQKNKKR